MSNANPILSIIIVNFNKPELIRRCLASIDSFLVQVQKEVIVIDNNSHDENLDDLEQRYRYLKTIRLRENAGFGRANNIGVQQAIGDIILLLNSDTECIDQSLSVAANKFRQTPRGTLWGLRLSWPDGKFQNSFSREIHFLDFACTYTPISRFTRIVKRVREHKYDGAPLEDIREVGVVYGAAMLMYRDDFLALEGFSRRYFMYFEDIDFCDRFRKQLGGHVFYYPHSTVIHHVEGSSQSGKRAINWLYLKSKYLYGIRRFGIAGMFLIALLDAPLLAGIAIRSWLVKSKW